MAVSIAITYFLFEDQFEMDGLKIKKPEFNFFKSKPGTEINPQNQETSIATASS